MVLSSPGFCPCAEPCFDPRCFSACGVDTCGQQLAVISSTNVASRSPLIVLVQDLPSYRFAGLIVPTTKPDIFLAI